MLKETLWWWYDVMMWESNSRKCTQTMVIDPVFFLNHLLRNSSHDTEDNQETCFDCYLSSFFLCSLLSATRTLISGSRILFPIHFFLEGRIMDAEQVKRFEWFSLNRRCRFICARWLSWLNVSHKKTALPAFCHHNQLAKKMSTDWHIIFNYSSQPLVRGWYKPIPSN